MDESPTAAIPQGSRTRADMYEQGDPTRTPTGFVSENHLQCQTDVLRPDYA